MKEFYIRDLKKDMDITDFFMVKSIGLKIGSNGKEYLDLLLSDKTGDINSKKWDIGEQERDSLLEIKDKDIVKVKGLVTEWNGQTQLRIQRIRVATNEDNQDITDFVKSAPEPSNEMYDYIYNVANNMQDDDLKRLCVKLLTENKEKLMYYPAATKNHHAQYGGLLYHTKRMLMTGERACEVYTNLNRDLVLTGVIIHDIEKLTEIVSDTYGIATTYSFEGNLLGHIVQGVKLIDRVTMELGFSDEKRIMLEHMILAHHYEPEFGSPKKPLFPEAELLHYLDILDSRMFDMEAALANTDEGEFSDRVWTLDNRKLYKATF